MTHVGAIEVRGTGYSDHNSIDFDGLPFMFKLGHNSPRA